MELESLCTTQQLLCWVRFISTRAFLHDTEAMYSRMVCGECTGREVYVVTAGDRSGIARCFNALNANGEPHRSVDGTTEAFYPRSVPISLTACAEKPWLRSIGRLERGHFAVYRQMNYTYNPLGFAAAQAHLDAGAGRWPVLTCFHSK